MQRYVNEIIGVDGYDEVKYHYITRQPLPLIEAGVVDRNYTAPSTRISGHDRHQMIL